ncbi:MAG: transglutaminase domain-containing protein [Chloroflexi bacterium]|nr:transglutaminase domain-containing protein [Chloroflexota bacterium]
MRQASWNEMFAPKREPLVLTPDVPREPAGWRRVFWWEDVLSFLLLSALVLAVVDSVYRAGWVDEMPSLYPLAFIGLLMAAMLARVRWPEAVIHLLALPVGAAVSLATILSIVPGATPWARYEELHERMGAWFNVAFNGGISNDELPFIVLVVPLAWIAAYLSSWAVFRWQNVWLALIPAGFLLLSNVSYFSDQFSFSVLVFLLAAVLLVTRLHLMSRSKSWREQDTPYPPFLSLSVLHITFWLAIVLLLAAWIMPQAGESGPLASAWEGATSPITERATGLSRLFVSVRGPQSASVHRFEDIVPFQGPIELPDTLVLDVLTEPLDQRRYLRSETFEVYTPTGWQQSRRIDRDLEADEITRVDRLVQERSPISIFITSKGETGDNVFTIGQPRRVNRGTTVQWNVAVDDVVSVEITNGVREGSTYQAVGSLSVATEDDLRAVSDPALGLDYPTALQSLYTGLPPRFHDHPDRIHGLATDLSVGEPNIYDKAVAIEDYLRTFPIDLEIPVTPRDRDTIDYFLFDLQRGYFDYHASAMVVMLRSMGIPSRLAIGYVLQPSERVSGSDRYLVTEQSAFAWPEVYFPGYGWIEFNPTPSQPRIQRSEPVAVTIGDDEDGGGGAGSLGLENLPGQLGADGDASSVSFGGGSSSNRNLWVLAGIAAGIAAMASLGAGWGRYLWVRGIGGAPAAARRWEQTLRLASWSGNAPDPAQTPHEYASSLRERVRGLDDVELLADDYVSQRFGRGSDDATDTRLDEAWEHVRNGLLRKLLRLR